MNLNSVNFTFQAKISNLVVLGWKLVKIASFALNRPICTILTPRPEKDCDMRCENHKENVTRKQGQLIPF